MGTLPDRILIDKTDLAVGTHHYPGPAGERTLSKDLSFTGILEDVDGTIGWQLHGTNGNPAVAESWHNVTWAGYRTDKLDEGGEKEITVTNGTEKFAIDFDGFNYDYWRVEIVTGGPTNRITTNDRRKIS